MAALASKNWTAQAQDADRADLEGQRSIADRSGLAGAAGGRGDARQRHPGRRGTDLVAADASALRPHRDRYGYHALASGGIGWGLPASVGVSLANPDRPVVCYSGDGSSMYSIQSLWTAAQSQAAADLRHRQQWRLSHHQAAAARLPRRRSLRRHGFRRSAGGFHRRGQIAGAGGDRRSPIPKELKSVLSSAFSRPGAKLIEVVVSNSVN